MNNKLTACVIATAFMMTIALWPTIGYATGDSTATPKPAAEPEEPPTVLDRIVGEYNLVTGTDIFLPHQMCIVNTDSDVLELLQKCKNQRKGWLKL